MATTSYGVNDAEAVKQWSRRLMRESLKQTFIYQFIGKGSDALVQIKDEASKAPGDRITMTLRMQLSGAGVLGDGTLEGNEEALTTYTDTVLIDQLRHAVRSAGKMSEQRVPFSVRSEALQGLSDWWADRLDTAFFNQVCGYTAQSDIRYTGGQAPAAPSAGRILRANAEDKDEDLDSAETFDLQLVDKAVEQAKTATPLIRPVMVKGKGYYVMFLHPYQVTDLRTATSAGQWLDIQKAAMAGGSVDDNPIFSGALGVYNGVVLHESTRVTPGVHSVSGATVADTRRAVLCGAQAASLAFGRESGPTAMDWFEELFDYGNQLGVSAGCLFGLKKSVFDQQDFGTVVVTTHAAAHA